MRDTWITNEMRALVGQEYGEPRTSTPISLSDIRKWALAIYYPEVPPRLFWDEAYATTTRHGGIVAPEEFNPFAWFTADGPVMPSSYEGVLTGTGPEKAFGVAAPGTTGILNGGVEAVHGVRMRPDDVITAGKTRLLKYQERPSRLGLMLITVNETTWTNQRGEMVKVSRGTGIRY